MSFQLELFNDFNFRQHCINSFLDFIKFDALAPAQLNCYDVLRQRRINGASNSIE